MNVEELMHTPAITCRPYQTLADAAGLMWDHDCGAIAVVNDDGRLISMITDRDICMAAYTQGLRLESIRISSAMAKQTFACHPEDSVERAERAMSEHQVRRLPVIDRERRPVGLLSLADIARHAAASRSDGVSRQLAAVLSRISAPRAAEARAAE